MDAAMTPHEFQELLRLGKTCAAITVIEFIRGANSQPKTRVRMLVGTIRKLLAEGGVAKPEDNGTSERELSAFL
jgi:hypothetical protein